MKKREPPFWTDITKRKAPTPAQALARVLALKNPLDWHAEYPDTLSYLRGLERFKADIARANKKIKLYWDKGYTLEEAVAKAHIRSFVVLPRRGWWKIAWREYVET